MFSCWRGYPQLIGRMGPPLGGRGDSVDCNEAICCILGVSSPYRPRKRFHSRLSHARLLTQAARVAPGLRVLATRAEPGRSLAGGGESPTCGEITPAHKQPMILSHTPTSVHARFFSCAVIPGVGKPMGKFGRGGGKTGQIDGVKLFCGGKLRRPKADTFLYAY